MHRFGHNFNCHDPCCIENETTEHYLIRCPLFANPRITLFDSLERISPSITQRPHHELSHLLLYGKTEFNKISNKIVIEATFNFIKFSKRFKTLEAYIPLAPND